MGDRERGREGGERERMSSSGSENSAQAFPVFPWLSVWEGRERGTARQTEREWGECWRGVAG